MGRRERNDFSLGSTDSGAWLGVHLLRGVLGVGPRCAERMQEAYPGLRIAGIVMKSPPIRPSTPRAQWEPHACIQRARHDLLLVAFGQPKGELWINQHDKGDGVSVSIHLAASFDFIAGTVGQAPQVWQRCGVKCGYRMLSDPKRRLTRYAANARFWGPLCSAAEFMYPSRWISFWVYRFRSRCRSEFRLHSSRFR